MKEWLRPPTTTPNELVPAVVAIECVLKSTLIRTNSERDPRIAHSELKADDGIPYNVGLSNAAIWEGSYLLCSPVIVYFSIDLSHFWLEQCQASRINLMPTRLPPPYEHVPTRKALT